MTGAPTSTKEAITRELYSALAAGDRDALDRLLHPSFIGHATAGLPLDMGGTHDGPENMQRELWWRIGRHYSVAVQVSAMSGIDDGRLLVTGHYRGSARRSGNALDAAFVHVIGFTDDGRIASLDQVTDSAAWVAALGDHPPLTTIDYTVADGLATICLNRPAARNAINQQLADELLLVAHRITDDRSVRAVLICGNGEALSVGGDIGHFLTSTDYAHLFVEMTTPFHEAFRLLSRIDAPIVTAVHGVAAGGGLGFVYAADIVLAAEGTRFVTAFTGIGLSGDGGGTWHLPRLVGARRAAQMYLENTPIDADTAVDWGLINEVVPADELRARATARAELLARGPTRAYGRLRSLLRESWHRDLAAQLRAETDALETTSATTDATTAIAAFAAKEPPHFTGR
jgi:2-(1,2-epoxy-1,2-dihydrophenyl)acetyl-CoA isomerase